MKKSVAVFFIVVFALLLAGGAAGYGYLRWQLAKVAPKLQSLLARDGVQFRYESVETPPVGLFVKLHRVSATSPRVAYPATADAVTIRVGLGWWPPFKISVVADNAVLDKLAFSKLEVATRVSTWDERGLRNSGVSHEAVAPNFVWRGESRYEENKIIAKDHRLSLGDFDFSAEGEFEPSSKSWQLTLVDVKSGATRAKAKGTALEGEANLDGITLTYETAAKKKIQVTNLTGFVSFSPSSLSATDLKVSFPNSDLIATFSVSSFSHPDGKFTLSASRLSLKDFVDLPPGTPTPPVPVVFSEKDFRGGPLFKNTKLVGDLNLKKVDLGNTKCDSIVGKVSYDKLVLRFDPLIVALNGGTIQYTSQWNGRIAVPKSTLEIKAENLDADPFLTNLSKDMKDQVHGRLSANMNFQFDGLTSTQMRKSTRGSGDFLLTDGRLKVLKLAKKPLEEIKKIPLLGAGVLKTDLDDRVNTVKGTFQVADGKFQLSEISLSNAEFDAVATNTIFHPDGSMNARIVISPKEGVLAKTLLDALKDDSGKPSIPITLSGSAKNPTASVAQTDLEKRMKSKAVEDLKENAERELKKFFQQ